MTSGIATARQKIKEPLAPRRPRKPRHAVVREENWALKICSLVRAVWLCGTIALSDVHQANASLP